MKLGSFLIGMFAATLAVGVATWSVSGSWGLVAAMCIATLFAAQILYVLMLVAMARFRASRRSEARKAAGSQTSSRAAEDKASVEAE